MTDEWLEVEVGDVLIESRGHGERREVLSVSRAFVGGRLSGPARGSVRTRIALSGTHRRIVVITNTANAIARAHPWHVGMTPRGWKLEKRAGDGSVVRMTPLLIKNIKACARCGEDHAEVTALPLARQFEPPEAAPIVWTHWAPCPTNGDPILFMTNAVMRTEGSAVIPSRGMPDSIPLTVSADEYAAELARIGGSVFRTEESAIAAALTDAKAEGGDIAIHEATCTKRSADDECTCTPIVVKPGPEA